MSREISAFLSHFLVRPPLDAMILGHLTDLGF